MLALPTLLLFHTLPHCLLRVWRRRRQRSALARARAAACRPPEGAAPGRGAAACCSVAGGDSEGGSGKLGSRSCEEAQQQAASDGARVGGGSQTGVPSQDREGGQALGPSLPGLARLHRRNPSAHRTCVLLAAAGCYEIAILGQNVAPGLVDPSVGELEPAGGGGGECRCGSTGEQPMACSDRRWTAASLTQWLPSRYSHAEGSRHRRVPLPIAVMLLSLFTVVCVAVLSRLWLKAPVQWAAVVPAAAVMLGGAAMVLVPDIQASGVGSLCLHCWRCTAEGGVHAACRAAWPGSLGMPLPGKHAPWASEGRDLTDGPRRTPASAQGGAGEPGSLTTTRAWLGFAASVGAMLGNTCFIVLAQASRGCAAQRSKPWRCAPLRCTLRRTLARCQPAHQAPLAPPRLQAFGRAANLSAIKVQYTIIGINLLVVLPVSLGVDGADWGPQFAGMNAKDWGALLYCACLAHAWIALLIQVRRGRRPGGFPPWLWARAALASGAPAPAHAVMGEAHGRTLNCCVTSTQQPPPARRCAAGEHGAAGRAAGVPVLRDALDWQRGGQQAGAGRDDCAVGGAGGSLRLALQAGPALENVPEVCGKDP